MFCMRAQRYNKLSKQNKKYVAVFEVTLKNCTFADELMN
jgi:hypothetical protein